MRASRATPSPDDASTWACPHGPKHCASPPSSDDGPCPHEAADTSPPRTPITVPQPRSEITRSNAARAASEALSLASPPLPIPPRPPAVPWRRAVRAATALIEPRTPIRTQTHARLAAFPRRAARVTRASCFFVPFVMAFASSTAKPRERARPDAPVRTEAVCQGGSGAPFLHVQARGEPKLVCPSVTSRIGPTTAAVRPPFRRSGEGP